MCGIKATATPSFTKPSIQSPSFSSPFCSTKNWWSVIFAMVSSLAASALRTALGVTQGREAITALNSVSCVRRLFWVRMGTCTLLALGHG